MRVGIAAKSQVTVILKMTVTFYSEIL